jgi:hypothetical protein
MFHQKINRIPSPATAKAFVNIPAWVDIKRRCFLIVEWAQSNEVGTSPFQINEVAYNIFGSCCFDNFPDRVWFYQALRVLFCQMNVKNRHLLQIHKTQSAVNHFFIESVKDYNI